MGRCVVVASFRRVGSKRWNSGGMVVYFVCML